MNYTSCIRQPEKSPFIQLHQWQVQFCHNNHCAALLLSVFIAWHDWKCRHDDYYRRVNNIAEVHGEGRPHSENAYLFFTTEQLIEYCMGLYGKKAINEGLNFLKSLSAISIHNNPNPRYHFDKTKYFQFYPDVCNHWITENYYQKSSLHEKETQLIDSYDRVKIPDRESENALPSSENGRPSGKNTQAITYTTYNNTNKNQSINARENFSDLKSQTELNPLTVEQILTHLRQKGLSSDALRYPDVPDLIAELISKGAILIHFLTAYDLAVQATSTKGGRFGVRYLAKVVENLLNKSNLHSKPPPAISSRQEVVYQNDFSGGMDWMGDLVTDIK